jgi:hypothetical protein
MALLKGGGASMRNLMLGVALAVSLAVAHPVAAGSTRTRTQGEEAGYAIAAAALNLVYLPVKTVVAVGGLALGAFTGLMTGGDTRAAYAIWVPAASGTFLLTPAHIEERKKIEFFGADYGDRPNKNMPSDRSTVYDALYVR